MEVDTPAAVLANALADLLAELVDALDVIEAVDHRALRVGGDTVGAETGVDAGFRYLLGCASRGVTGGVALDVVAGLAAQKLIDREAESFAFQVPEGNVEGA